MTTTGMGRYRLLIALWILIPSAWAATGQPSAEPRCEIYRDSVDIAHARAVGGQNGEEGALRCLGYLHGLDRAFQLDFLRRAAQGRLSEILGSRTLKQDFTLRLFGLKEEARRMAASLPPREHGLITAYVSGVRAGMARAVEQGVYEFRDLGYRPEEWTLEDSLSIALLQAFDQTRRSLEQKVREAQARQEIGSGAENLLRLDDLPWFTTILKPEEMPVRERNQGAARAPQNSPVPGLRRPLPPESNSTGSNNWAIAPSRSRTGRAWFANDPHLDLRYPSFWYWSEIQGGAWDVVGASVPGMPIVASGANRAVAWGLTNSYFDTMDVYEVPEEDLRDAVTIRPVVWLKLFGPVRVPIFFKSFRRTREGWPVLPIPAPKGKAIVLRWSGLTLKGGDLSGFFDVLGAGSAVEMDRALSRIGLPSWNVAFADSRGQIGYRMIGKVPRHEQAEPFGFHAIRLSEAPKWEYLSPEEQPHLLNPKRGFVVTANNPQWPEGTAPSDGRRQVSSFRAFRIEELLRARPKHDLESNRAIQCDTEAVDARFFLPELLKQASKWQDLVPREKEALSLLKAWDLKTGVECRACGVFRFWLHALYERKGWNSTMLAHVLLNSESFAPGSFEIDARQAFSDAVNELLPNPGAPFPTWGEIHQAPFGHIAGEERYPHPWIPTPGDDNSVSPGEGGREGRMIRQKSGASQRLIVDLQSPPRVWRILPGTARDLKMIRPPEKGSPWQKWASCELDSVSFPLDWSQVKAEEIRF